MRHKNRPSLEEIRELISYNPETGILKWKKPRQGIKKNRDVGWVNQDGYIRLKILNHSMMAHVIAWLLYYGNYPEDEIDHINRDKKDNRIENLRVVSHRENCLNKKRDRKYPCVYSNYRSSDKRYTYTVHIEIDGQQYNCGTYDDEDEAYNKYIEIVDHYYDTGELHDLIKNKRKVYK